MGLGGDFHFEPAPDIPGSDMLSKIIMSALRRTLDLLWDVEVTGRDNVPHHGGAIIAPNHLSFCDSMFVPSALPRRMWAIGKGEYMDDWKTKHLFPALGMIPVDRGGGEAAQAALDTAATVLDAEHLFLIYPEGTRSRSEYLHKGRTGVARLAARCDVPVVPVGHIGTLAIQPPTGVMMHINKPCTIRFGEPMAVSDFGSPDDPRVIRRFTDELMFAIAELSDQTYVHQYASKDDRPGVLAPSAPAVTKPGAPSPKVSVPKGRKVIDRSDTLRIKEPDSSNSDRIIDLRTPSAETPGIIDSKLHETTSQPN